MAKQTIGSFDLWDYVVLTLILLISASIGIYYGCTGGKQKTTGEFLMADRQMTVLPVTLSLLASFMSAIMLLGTPAEIYTFGTQYCTILSGYLIMIPVTAHLFLPIFFKLRLTSVFEVRSYFSNCVYKCIFNNHILYIGLYNVDVNPKCHSFL